MHKDLYDVVGIGNAIVDVLAKVGDGFLKERNLNKGTMTLVDAAQAGNIYKDIIAEREVSGGSVANTVAGIASLGGTPAFIGKVHDDELGKAFRRDIGASGVDFFTQPLKQGPSTARSVILVTPDAERSMFTYLGASTLLSPEDIDEEIIKSTNILYLEGYLWDSAKEAMIKACEFAKLHGKTVAFSLSDPFCVKRYKNEFLPFIKEYVTILFANEEEIKSLYEKQDLFETLDLVKHDCLVAAVTRSSKGSVVVSGKSKTFVDAEEVENAVDTTGAGDLYAAGFLYAFSQGRSLNTCAIVGGIAAAEIISHYGARPEVSLRGFVRNKLKQYGKII